MLLRFRGIALFFVCLTGQAAAWASDTIYVAYGEDGAPHFSTQPYDKNFRIYSLDPSKTVKPQAKLVPVTRAKPSSLDSIIREKAQQYGLDPALIGSIVAIESAYNPSAVSSKGAVGAMQLIPSTARQYGVRDPYDVQQNLDGGARYLKDLLAAYNDNLPLALAAYNAGQRNVSKHHQRIPPFAETMLYVPKVLAKMAEYHRQNAGQP